MSNKKAAENNLKQKPLENMIIAVSSKTGNCGKSTYVNNVLAPRISDLAMVAYVESANTIEGEIPAPLGQKYTAHEYQSLEQELLDIKLKGKSAIVDFGANDINVTLQMLEEYPAARKRVDMWIVPCVPSSKEILDTIEYLLALRDLGIDMTKVHVLFNKVQRRDVNTLKRMFAPIFSVQADINHEDGETFNVKEAATVFSMEIFKVLAQNGKSLQDVLADNTDYEKAILTAKTDDDKFSLAGALQLRDMAEVAVKSLDRSFKALVE